MLYLSGVSSRPAREAALAGLIGFVRTPDSVRDSQCPLGVTWAADNRCYADGEGFDLDRFLGWLDGLDRTDCLWATAPDVVGDAEATWERSRPVIPRLRELGYRVAYVAQDGLTPAATPWAEVDALFLGGTTEWKLGTEAAGLAVEAKRRGLAVHMGRVNSLRRMRHAQGIGCDTVDGTYLARSPDVNLPRLLRFLGRVHDEPPLWIDA